MKLARISTPAGPRTAVVDGATAQPLGIAPLDLLAAAPEQRDALAAGAREGDPIALDEAHLLAPLQPASVRDFMTFERHVEGALRTVGRAIPAEWYERPQFYFSNAHALVGPDEPVAVPPGCSLLDFELEVAAIVGRAGRDLTPEQARDHIAGYAILNDWSARDLQAGELPVGLGPAKAKDFALGLGPWIVTADELEDRRRDDRLDLRLRASVNGVELGSDSLASMAWSFEELVAYASRGADVLPGDVLGSGTCGGGCLLELWGRNGSVDPPPLRPGDSVTLTVERLGSLTNAIVAGTAPVPIAAARRVVVA